MPISEQAILIVIYDVVKAIIKVYTFVGHLERCKPSLVFNNAESSIQIGNLREIFHSLWIQWEPEISELASYFLLDNKCRKD